MGQIQLWHCMFDPPALHHIVSKNRGDEGSANCNNSEVIHLQILRGSKKEAEESKILHSSHQSDLGGKILPDSELVDQPDFEQTRKTI